MYHSLHSGRLLADWLDSQLVTNWPHASTWPLDIPKHISWWISRWCVAPKRHLCRGPWCSHGIVSVPLIPPSFNQGFRNVHVHINHSNLYESLHNYVVEYPANKTLVKCLGFLHFGRIYHLGGNGIGGSLSPFLWVNLPNFHHGTQRPTAAECWSCTKARPNARRFLADPQGTEWFFYGKIDRTPGGLGVWKTLKVESISLMNSSPFRWFNHVWYPINCQDAFE